jgi:drug/metabolite transporter (DMT)-like permease
MQWTHETSIASLAAMFALMIPMVVVVAAGALYHLTLHSVSSGPSPWLTLAPAYGIACAISSLMWWLAPESSMSLDRRQLGGAVLLAIAVIGIEAGFFFVYRAGWVPSHAAIVASVAVTVVLAIVGVVLYGEHLTPGRVLGLTMAGSGVWLALGR